MGFFDKIKQGFKKTSDAVSHSLDSVFAAFVKIDEDLLEELEEALILSDVGASTSAKIGKACKAAQDNNGLRAARPAARGADRQHA